MEPVDEGKSIPERKLSMRTAKELSTNSKESILTDEEENEIDEKTEVNLKDFNKLNSLFYFLEW
jgi:hypothetical protein